MKILHVIDSMAMGGAQSLLVELTPAQKAAGNEVEILEITEAPDRTLADKLASNGVRVFSLPKKRHLRNPLNIFAVARIVRNYDIAHVHLFPANYWAALAKFVSRCKTPIITTEHSTKNKRRGKKVLELMDRFVYQRYSEVVACGDKAMDTFRAAFPGIECVSIPNGVNIKKYRDAVPYSKQELLGIDDDSFVTVMVSRFIPSKRQDTLVKALASLPGRYHTALVGGTADDDGLQKIKSLARSLGVDSRVHFLYLRPDVPRILKTCDAIALSSEYEGLSLSSIEGMASGRPFIASDVDGLREIVSGAGVLVGCADEHAMAEAIKRLDEDAEYRASVVDACISRADEYDIAAVAEKYQNEYIKTVRS